MPSGYRHLTRHDRCQIQALRKRGFSQRAIAAETDRSQSAVSREIFAQLQAASAVPRRMTPAHRQAVEES